MAANDEVIRLVLETKGQETIERLEKSTAEYKELLKELASDYAKGEIETAKFLKTSNAWSAELAKETTLLEQLRTAQKAQTAASAAAETQTLEMATAVDTLEDELNQVIIATGKAQTEFTQTATAAAGAAGAIDKVDAAAKKGKGGMAGFGQSALQAGRIIQDFQAAGVMGIANNLEGMALALGGGAGLAGGLTLLATAYLAFKPQIEEFFSTLGDANAKPILDTADAVGFLQKRIKELEDKKVKIQIDVDEINRAKDRIDEIKKGLAALEAAKSGRTADEIAAGDKFTKEFEGTGKEGKEAVEAVERIAGDAFVARDPKARAARKELEDRRRQIAAAEKALEEANQRRQAAMASGDSAALGALGADASARSNELNRLRDPEAFKTLADNVRNAEKAAREAAGAEVGNNIAAVKQGNNPLARDVLAERFRAAGQERFAAMAEAASPQAIAAKKAAELAAQQADDLDKHNAEQSKAGAAELKRRGDAAEQERLRQANDDASALERDPTVQAELKRNREKFGDFRNLEGAGGEEARAKAQQINAQAEGAKADRRALNPETLAAAEETQRIMNENLGISRAMASRIQQIEANNRQLAQAARQLNRQVRMPGQPNLPMGHQ